MSLLEFREQYGAPTSICPSPLSLCTFAPLYLCPSAPSLPPPMLEDNDLQSVQKLCEAYRQITSELSKVIVGQKQVIEELLVAMFARGHCLLVGVPGLAKTLMIRSVAD